MDRELGARVAGASDVYVVGAAEIERLYPVAAWADVRSEATGRVPYTPEYFAALGTMAARRLHGARARTAKVVVLDCDNTLWGGACGEEGARGVRLEEGHLELQRRMAAQAEAGRLICLCSKNAEADVRAVFEARPEMPLRWDSIAAHRVNWESKAANLRSLADELNLSTDSFVFIDDSPVECAEVVAALPEILTLQLPAEAARIPAFLDHVWPLDVLRVTDEDRARRGLYVDNARREDARRSSATLSDFIASLELNIDIARVEDAELERAAQLTERTSQFNAQPDARSAAELRAVRDGGVAVCDRVTVRDRYGDYGFVGLLLAHARGDALETDALMLSCRALGRGVEHRMLAHLGAVAEARGARVVRIPFRTTARNEPVRRFLAALERAGRARIGSVADGGVFEIDAAEARRVVYDPSTAEADANAAADSSAASSRRPASIPANDLLRRIPSEWPSAAAVWSAIRRDVRSRPELQQSYVEPRAGLERRIASIWSDVLHIDRVGAEDRFSDLGGTSLHVVRVHARLAAELDSPVDITMLFALATVRALAERIGGTRADGVVDARERALRQRAAIAALRPAGSR